MVAHIYKNDSMLSVGKTPWHGRGLVLATPPATAHEALVASGLDWTVRREDTFLQDGRKVAITCGDKAKDKKQCYGAVIRNDTNEILGSVGPSHHILQNEEMLNLFDPLIREKVISVETCGSLFDGRIVWFLGKTNNTEATIDTNEMGKDSVRAYMLLAHSHDQSMSVSYGFTSIRVVCYNTLSAALGKGASMIKVKHTKHMHDNLKVITDAINVSACSFDLQVEQLVRLSKRGVTTAGLKEYAKRVCKVEEDKKITPQQQKRMDRIVQLAKAGRGNSGRNLWHAYNGYTEYLTWEYGKSTDTRLRSLWFGDNVSANLHGFNVALEMANGA